jgi:glycerophosphoryl diester phosphodiesterase
VRRIGHRGARGYAPDNTIASFQRALDLACDEVETDVWLLEDGAFVIAHDRPATSAGVLGLDDVLDFCRGRMGVNVELKCEGSESRARDTGMRAAEHLARRGDDAVYVSSFWWSALEGVREAAPAVRRAYLFASSPPRRSLIADARATALWALHPNRAYVTAELVREAHAAGLQVQAWTVNDVEEIARFAALGVDGIMSDFPDRIPKP